MTTYLLPLLLLLSLPAFSQTTAPKSTGTPSSTICIPVASARTITKSLQQYELLKPAYIALSETNKELYKQNTLYKEALVASDSALVHSQKSYTTTNTLYKDSQLKEQIATKKAKKRGLKIAILVFVEVATIALSIL